MEIESLVSVSVCISSRLSCNLKIVSFFLVFLSPCLVTVCGSIEVLVDGALVSLIVCFVLFLHLITECLKVATASLCLDGTPPHRLHRGGSGYYNKMAYFFSALPVLPWLRLIACCALFLASSAAACACCAMASCCFGFLKVSSTVVVPSLMALYTPPSF